MPHVFLCDLLHKRWLTSQNLREKSIACTGLYCTNMTNIEKLINETVSVNILNKVTSTGFHLSKLCGLFRSSKIQASTLNFHVYKGNDLERNLNSPALSLWRRGMCLKM